VEIVMVEEAAQIIQRIVDGQQIGDGVIFALGFFIGGAVTMAMPGKIFTWSAGRPCTTALART
jgi:hypothetical protein